MSNATDIIARSAALVDHDEFVAFFSAEENITAFTRTQVRESILADAAAGDYFAQRYVAMEAHYFAKLEAMDLAELKAFIETQSEQHYAAYLEFDDMSEYDVDDYESFHAEQYRMGEVVAYREAREVYAAEPQGPLTHRPFAALAVAA